MNKSKKAIRFVIAAAAALLCLALIVAAVHVPDLKKGVQSLSVFRASQTYVVSVMPNTDDEGYETQTVTGIDRYWRDNHSRGRGVEAVLQQTKDGELVVLAGDLQGSNAEALYGKDVQIGSLTLQEAQQINLLYDTTDEDGFRIYSTVSERSLISVSVLSLTEYLTVFNDAEKTNARHFLRFADESAIKNLHDAIDKVYAAVKETEMLETAVLCLQSKDGAKYVDEAHSDLLRAATPGECRALYFACLTGVHKKNTPYVLVYADAESRFGKAKFIHYAKNCGLAVVLLAEDGDKLEKTAVRLYHDGADAVATHQPQAVIQSLLDAKQAEKGSETEVDSTAAP